MELNGDSEQENIVNALEKWFEENPELPSKIDRIYLTRFYYRTSKDIGETKKILEDHFTIRNKSLHIYFNRDPENQDTRNTVAFANMVALPGLTPEKIRVVLIGCNSPDPKMMHFTEDIRNYIMVNDGRFSMPDVVVDGKPLIAEGVIQIIDMNNIGMRHIPHVSISTLRIFLKYLQQVCPVIIKSIHIINCPTYINKIFAVGKPFLKKKVIEMIVFHMNGLDTLYDHIPRDMLPEEYGGKAGPLADLIEQFLESVREKRDYLMDPDYWVIQKS